MHRLNHIHRANHFMDGKGKGMCRRLRISAPPGHILLAVMLKSWRVASEVFCLAAVNAISLGDGICYVGYEREKAGQVCTNRSKTMPWWHGSNKNVSGKIGKVQYR